MTAGGLRPYPYEEPPLDEIVRRIAETFDPERILLFGSRARGDARPDSDVDLVVIMRTKLPPFERMFAVRRLFPHRRWAFDVVVYTPEEWSREEGRVGTLAGMVKEDAKVLYARP